MGDAIEAGASDGVLVGAVAYEFPDAGTLEISRLVIDPRMLAKVTRGRSWITWMR